MKKITKLSDLTSAAISTAEQDALKGGANLLTSLVQFFRGIFNFNISTLAEGIEEDKSKRLKVSTLAAGTEEDKSSSLKLSTLAEGMEEDKSSSLKISTLAAGMEEDKSASKPIASQKLRR